MKPFDFKLFTVAYTYEGQRWEIYIPARSHEEAQDRFMQLRKGFVTGVVVGVVGESGCLTNNQN